MKDIPNYEGIYAITKDGKVWSYRRNKWLQPLNSKRGYVTQILCLNGVNIQFKVHRLVMLTYIGKSDLQVNHINGIKDDNRLENLEYCNQSHNIRHADKLGLRIPNKGIKNGRSILTNKDVLFILSTDIKNSVLAKKYNVSRDHIAKIKKGNAWKHLTEEGK
jgi:hypothetical protein